MSSVTFLVSAVLTVCLLHAFDESVASSTVDKLNLNTQSSVENIKPNTTEPVAIKPLEAQMSAQNVQVYGVKKREHLLPTSQNASKNLAIKDSKAI